MPSINNNDDQSIHHNPTASHQHIFEFFLFVNPMGTSCLDCEKEVLSFIENTDKKIYFRIITYHDFHLFNDYLKSRNMNNLSIEDRNKLYQAMYHISIGYKAALLQGKKIGRTFLMKMQEHFGNQNEVFSFNRMKELASNLNRFDISMWEEDMSLGMTKEDYSNDLKLARQMQITSNPSLVIFDNQNFRYGVRIEENITAENLDIIANQMINNSEDHLFEYKKSAFKAGKENKRTISKINCDYLRLLEQ